MKNTMKKLSFHSSPRRSAGMSLLDILLAMVIFAVGMLALAHLQSNLARNSGDANSRTVAANVGEELIEALRTYSTRELTAGDSCPTDIAGMKTKRVFECVKTPSASWSFQRGGVDYTVDLAVDDWYFKSDGISLTKDKTDSDLSGRDLDVPDFKELSINVSWEVLDFQISETQTSELGSGSFAARGIVPSVPVLGSAKIAADDDGAMGTPPVAYTPGQLPDVIPISVDGSKFKESETPMPDVVRSDNIVETWFDVITYNLGSGDDASEYLRREEFAVVACECTLRNSAGGEGGDGFLPTTWNGEEYSEGAWVAKQYGESANNQQSQYCDTCCRDHHDSPGNSNADTLYRPSTGSAHAHYVQSKQGAWSTASAGDDYLEVCRMVRKDGFMRVAQDFNLNGMLATRQDFFTSTSNVDTYSTHVTNAVTSEYSDNSGVGTVYGDLTLPGDTSPNAVPLPTAGGATFDQQVSRALYTDHVTAELQDALDCLQRNDDTCTPPGVDSAMEILPFYEIQTTWLSFWRDNVNGDPVEMSNDTIADDNSHSRGVAELTGTDAETVTADTYIHSGNNGLTSTDPIDPAYDDALVNRNLFITTNGGGGGGTPANPYGASGSMGGTGGIKVTDAVFTPSSGVYCNHDATSFDCVYDATVVDPSVTITGYVKNKDAWVCETSGTTPALKITTNDYVTGTAVIDLGAIGLAKVTTYHLSFQPSSCSD